MWLQSPGPCSQLASKQILISDLCLLKRAKRPTEKGLQAPKREEDEDDLPIYRSAFPFLSPMTFPGREALSRNTLGHLPSPVFSKVAAATQR